jgi:hypothetical protein
MLCYKDKTFCASPGCKNGCGRHITDSELQEAEELNFPISWAYFCGLPDDIYQSIKENGEPE